MNLSADHIEGLATETGFRPETLEKAIRLGEFAADVGRHPLLSRVLALKGGTALNLMFGSPARLSVDLDFNYIGQEARAGMQADRPKVERAIVIIGEGQGYHVQQSRDAHAGRKIYLSYTSSAGTPDRIEVDLNFLFRIPLGEVTTRPLWQPPGVACPEVRVVPLEELFTGKLRATLDRAWYVVKPLVTLDDAEREYIDRVHAGELLPDLLFPSDEELANRLARYPALLWKIENVKRHLSK